MIASESRWRIWIAPMITAILASVFLALLSLPEPRIGQVAGVVGIFAGGAHGFQLLLQIDPDLRWVDQRWNGHMIFVVSQRVDFVQRARQLGAVFMFDAKAVGCSFSSQNDKQRQDLRQP